MKLCLIFDEGFETDDFTVKDKIYGTFEQAYNEAEKYIPTCFAPCKLRNEKRKMKRNYYYLWQMAEAIKIEFYRINLVVIDFNKVEERKIYAKNWINIIYLLILTKAGN